MNKKNRKRIRYGLLALALCGAFASTCVLASANAVCTSADGDNYYRYYSVEYSSSSSFVESPYLNSSVSSVGANFYQYKTNAIKVYYNSTWLTAIKKYSFLASSPVMYDFTSKSSDFSLNIGFQFTNLISMEVNTTLYCAFIELDSSSNLVSVPMDFQFVRASEGNGIKVTNTDANITFTLRGGYSYQLLISSYSLNATANLEFRTYALDNVFIQDQQNDINAVYSEMDTIKNKIYFAFVNLGNNYLSSLGLTKTVEELGYSASASASDNVTALSSAWTTYNSLYTEKVRTAVNGVLTACNALGYNQPLIEVKRPLTYLIQVLNSASQWLASLSVSDVSTTERINNLLSTISEMQSKIESQSATIVSQKGEIKAYQSKVSELEAKITSLENQIKELGSAKYSFTSLFWGIANTPFSFLNSMLNFEFMGVNVLGLVTGLFTLVLAIILVKRFI